MTYKGHVENGVIVLEDGVVLPEGVSVEIIPPKLPPGEHHPDVIKFAGALASYTETKEDYYKHIWEKHQ